VEVGSWRVRGGLKTILERRNWGSNCGKARLVNSSCGGRKGDERERKSSGTRAESSKSITGEQTRARALRPKIGESLAALQEEKHDPSSRQRAGGEDRNYRKVLSEVKSTKEYMKSVNSGRLSFLPSPTFKNIIRRVWRMYQKGSDRHGKRSPFHLRYWILGGTKMGMAPGERLAWSETVGGCNRDGHPVDQKKGGRVSKKSRP